MNGNSVFTFSDLMMMCTQKMIEIVEKTNLKTLWMVLTFFFCYSSSKKHPFLFRFLSVCVQNIVWFRDLPLFEGPNIQSYFIDDFLPYFLGSITFLSFRNMVYKMVVHISSIIVQRPENIKVLCIFWACFVRLEKPVWVFLSPLNAH